MEEALRLHEFFIEGGDPEKSQVILHITEPSTREEQIKGIFFVLSEITGGTPDYIEELEKTIEQAKKIYYESPQQPEQALEQALDSVNKQSIHLIKPYATLESAIGVLVNNTIIFAFYGKPHITLFYKNRENSYLELDLVKQNSPLPVETPETNQTLFSQIIQGKITPGDYIFIASSGSLSVTKGDQLRQLITTRSPKESTMLIERGLRGLASTRSYGGLILSLTKPAVMSNSETKYRPQAHGSAASLQQFFSTEQKTNETLSSSIGRHLGNKLQSKIDTLNQTTHQNQRHSNSGEETNYIPPRARIRETARNHSSKLSYNTGKNFLLGISYLGKGILKIGIFIGNFFVGIAHTIGNCAVVISNYRNRRALVLDGWARTWRGYKEHFWQLPLLTKALFGVSLILIIVFIVSIFHIRSNQQQVAEQKAFDEGVHVLQTKLDSTESALIYNNTQTALAELTAAEDGLTLLRTSCAKPGRPEACSTIKKRIEELLLKVRNITSVDAQIITSLPLASATGMVKINTLLLAYSPNTSTIFTYNLLTKESGTLLTTSTGFIAAAVPKENDYALFLATDGTLLSFNPKDKTFKAQLFSLPSSPVGHTITSLTVYNRRLYSLDAATGQLYRHETIRGGFGPGREWVKDSSLDTRGSVDVTIDGDIFILNPNGTLKKFTNGLAQSFVLQTTDPLLTSARRISTYTDLAYLYLLDTTGKRLLMYDKTGKLFKQVMSPQFSGPADMIVDEPNKTVYIIDGDKIYKIDLPI